MNQAMCCDRRTGTLGRANIPPTAEPVLGARYLVDEVVSVLDTVQLLSAWAELAMAIEPRVKSPAAHSPTTHRRSLLVRMRQLLLRVLSGSVAGVP
jgi:hypothetical protein